MKLLLFITGIGLLLSAIQMLKVVARGGQWRELGWLIGFILFVVGSGLLSWWAYFVLMSVEVVK